MSYQTHKLHWLGSEYLVSLISVLVGVAGVWYIYSLGLVKELTDAHAHLNFSKMLFESLTPGISQIGFWPPLLHLLMAPFTQIPFLYNSGLAGAVVLIPFYVLGTVFSFKLLKLMTGKVGLAWLGALLFMFNPYVLYYTAAPMMEIMFIGNLMAVAYFVAAWLYEGKLSYLIGAAIFVMLATLSRFEGIILLPLVTAILLVALIQRRSRFTQIQASIILFLMVAVLGVLAIVSYSWMFGGSPVAFMGGEWVRSADASSNIRSAGSVIETIRYLLYSSYYMLSQNLVWFALLCLPFLLIVTRRRLEVASVLTILISPILFIALAVYQGDYNVAVPDVSPFNIYLNERYGLAWIGFVIVAPLLLINAVLKTEASRWIKYAGYATATAAIALMVYSAGDSLYSVAAKEKYFAIRNNINSPRSYQNDLAGFLSEKYDYGKILITRTDNDPVLDGARIPLSDYIYEANFRYFDQSLDEPWIFARWVVMFNPENEQDEWAKNNEAIARRWAENEQFANFYELVYENSGRRVYKVRQDKIFEYAQDNNLNITLIPSISPQLTKWNPGDFYNKLQLSLDVKKN